MYKLYYQMGTGVVVVQAALEQCSIAYQKIVVEDSKAADFLAINPMGAIPTLGLPDGSVMTESAAMVLHIADTHPQHQLMPPVGSSARAQAYRWLLFLASSGYGAALRRFHSEDNTTDAAGIEAVRAASIRDLHRYFQIIESAIETGPFLFGESYTIVDCYLWMLVAWQPETKEIYAANPKLAKLVEAVLDRPEVAKVAQEHEM